MREAFRKRQLRILAIVLAVVITLPSFLEIGILVRSSYKAYAPEYEKLDISEIVMKDTLSDEDYETLFLQTGLTKLGIDGLRENGLEYKIIKIQEQYFSEQSYSLKSFAPFTGYLKRNKVAEFAYLENGDILYSPTTFISFWRIGHTSMVVDANLGVMAQASGTGNPIRLVYIEHFFSRPAFVILRPKENLGVDAASYTLKELRDARYSIFAGIFGEKAPNHLSKTQCAHFIWYAYMQMGIDIDSNGGKIVTPDDILYSNELSVVQIYGISPDIFWSE